jgi:very-short-patch-repair endonuclease
VETGLLSTQRLRQSRLSASDIRRAVASGTLARVRRGWFALPQAHPDVIVAARVGGRLSCVSALRWHGAWTLHVHAPHVRVSNGNAVNRKDSAYLHWTSARVGPGVDDVSESLDAAMTCLDLRALVVVIDSLANRRIVDPESLRFLLRRTARGRQAFQAHDPAAESGTETLVRLALRRLHIRVRSQVTVPGVGRVDFLVGERLVIEVDGFEWHGDRSAFERDRARDRELVRRGYLVIRASYRQVLDDLDAVTVAVLDIVRRRDHLWRAVHRTRLSGSGYLVDVSSMRYRD